MYFSANNIRVMKLGGRMKVGKECSMQEMVDIYIYICRILVGKIGSRKQF
jgi:hypothetical protein